MFVNCILFSLNAFVSLRLVQDEIPPSALNQEEKALFRFFHARCGLTPLQFQEILNHGEFIEFPAGAPIPACGCYLYLVLAGVVECRAQNKPNQPEYSFIKRSGQFFDIKLFNLFSLPIGFDTATFRAQTIAPTKCFRWNIHGLVAMREAHSPSIKEYWEYMVLRAMTAAAIQTHLKKDETLYDSLLIPEHSSWLEGAPSRDFWKEDVLPTGTWGHICRQWQIIRGSLFQIIPPRGVRQRPGMPEGVNPKQAYIEMVCKMMDAEKDAPAHGSLFRFNSTMSSAPPVPTEQPRALTTTTPPVPEEGDIEAPPSNLFHLVGPDGV
eukprot:Nitzschia sp. Nitz4//scaffold207_size38617//12358//13326//NITZ4_007675-RA/size38617-processed-gene-0.31-mRNA-1//1//CDS//3329541605//4438//frame0